MLASGLARARERRGRRWKDAELTLARAQDFLTQYVQQAHPSPTQVAHHHKQPTSPGVASSSASDASSVFTTTTTDDTALASTAAAFGQLRTSEGVEGEQRIEAPSVKKGDWRTWGKVEARVLVWQDGALKKGKKASEQPKEEWVAEGTLWVTAVSRPSRIFW